MKYPDPGPRPPRLKNKLKVIGLLAGTFAILYVGGAGQKFRIKH